MFKQQRIIFFLIAAGCLLRLGYFLTSGSLVLDEVNIARTIQDYSFNEHIFFHIYDQSVHIKPLIFFLTVKSLILFLGSHEYVFRFLPLACSLISIGLYYQLSKRFLNGTALIASLCLFIFSPALIYYAGFLNTYSGDMMAALLLANGFFFMTSRDISTKWVWRWFLICAFAPWFSYASIIFVVIYNALLFIDLYRKKKYKEIFSFILFTPLVVMSVFVLSRLAFQLMLDSCIFQQDMRGTYILWDTVIATKLTRFYQLMISFFEGVMGWPGALAVLAIIGLVAGSFFALRRKEGWGIALPVILILLAIFLGFYPALTRTMLVTAPFMYILLGISFERIMGRHKDLKSVIGCAIIAALVISSLMMTAKTVFSQHGSVSRDTVKILKDNYQPGDGFIVSEYGFQVLLFYGDVERLWDVISLKPELLFGQTCVSLDIVRAAQNLVQKKKRNFLMLSKLKCFFNKDDYQPQGILINGQKSMSMDQKRPFIEKGRYWLFFAHHNKSATDFMLSYLRRFGKLTEQFSTEGNELYLFEYD